jgi:Family of unknown function (DUF6519)/FHA domain
VYGDFSRVLDGLSDRYSGVLAQQGRFVLDAELNEQTSILLDYMRELAMDLVGPFGGPRDDCGFKVELVRTESERHAIRLSQGHYYIYGLRCDVPTRYWSAEEELHIGRGDGTRLVYLVVWEQAVSAIQQPAIRDPGLSHDVPETTRRRQVRWRPMVASEGEGDERADPPIKAAFASPEAIVEAFDDHNTHRSRLPTLAARARADDEPDAGPATTVTARGYRGLENQLYRVEVHRGGDAEEATFKWSRDNGSVELALESLGELSDGFRLAALRRDGGDPSPTLEIGDWVEYVDDTWAPVGEPETLMQVAAISAARRQVTLRDGEHRARHFDAALHPLLRRWDQTRDSDGAEYGIPIRDAHRERWFEVEDGVQIRFEAHGARYERGDYWLIPARTATAGVLWPRTADTPLARHPNGPARFLVPLALLTGDDVTDLRSSFSRRAHEEPAAGRRRSALAEPAEPATKAEPAPNPEPAGEAEPGTEEHVGDEAAPATESATPSKADRKSQQTTLTRLEAPTEVTDPGEHHHLMTEAHDAVKRVEKALTRTFRVRSVGAGEPDQVFAVKDGVKVGRAEDVQIRLDHPDVSRHHAEFGVHHGDLTITDLASTNGTKVNGRPLPQNERTPVRHGDTIEVGSSRFQLQVEQEN